MTPPAVFFTAIASGAPVAAQTVPRDVAAAVVGGAIIGAGLFLLGTVLGLVEAPPWMQAAGGRPEQAPMVPTPSDVPSDEKDGS